MYREIEIGQDNNMRMHWLQFETHVLSLYAFACFLPHNSVVIFNVYPKNMITDCKLPPFRSCLRSARWNSSMRPSTCQFLGSHGAALVPRVPLGAAAFQHRCSRRKPLRWKKTTRKPPKTETTRNSLFTATNSNPTKLEKSSNIEAGKWGFVPTQSGIQPWPAAFWDWTNMGFHQGLSSAHYMTIWGLLKNHPWNSTYTDVYRIINFNWGWLGLFSVYPTRFSRELFGIPATFTLPPSSRLSRCFSWPPLKSRSMASMVLS